MSGWTAMVIIAAIIGFVELRKARRSVVDGNKGNEARALPDESELRREVIELRERIKVLEQITVEGRETRALADEIEKLRDN